jgi:hypothetical protein
MGRSRSLFIEKLVRRTAQAAIGPSALRNQGAAGVISGARSAAAALDLRRLGTRTSDSFPKFLDVVTAEFLEHFPPNAKHWGAARKAANLFLRDAVYNVDLSAEFRLSAVRSFLEVPLDRDIATGLLGQPEGSQLPEWSSIKGLKPETSAKYQLVASAVAIRNGVNRVDLDVYFWRPRSEAET